MSTPVDPLADDLIEGGIGAAIAVRDRRLARKGRVRCSLRVISGSQARLSRRWRQGVAVLSPGRLGFRRRWRAFASPLVEVVAVHGPVRLPEANEVFKVPGPIMHVQTPTAVLEFSVLSSYLPVALDLLGFADQETETGGRAPFRHRQRSDPAVRPGRHRAVRGARLR